MRVQGVSSDGSSAPVADSKDDVKTRGDDYWSNQKKEQFEKEMSRKEGSGSDKNNGDSQRKDSDLSSMFSAFAKQASSMTSTSVNAASQNSAVGSQTELQQLVTSLVDKILVSQPRLDGAHQVMLQLNDTVLTNTSITLTRDISGMLFVNIVSSDPLSFKKLMATKDMLEADLDTHEKNAFRVEVSFDGIEADGVHNDIRGQAGNSDAVLKDGENDNV
ncbi:hypothetical protein [uncultured Succinivibrio sp.]|uniref:hypothetical protein n=1 Tax=uncultured Succinivibrio sp. TaxID=540749 RepID=UPI0025DCA44F|nr:hypothetical protein [uncultured Succinivibrio sp.]